MQHLINGEWKRCTAQPGNCPYAKDGAPHLHSQEECNRFNDNVVLKYNSIKTKLNYKARPEMQEALKQVILVMEDEDDYVDVGELLAELSKYPATDMSNMPNDEIRNAYWLAYQEDVYRDCGDVIYNQPQETEDDVIQTCKEDMQVEGDIDEQINAYAKFVADYKMLPHMYKNYKDELFADKKEKFFDYQVQRGRLDKLFSDINYTKRELQEYREAFRLIQEDEEKERKAIEQKIKYRRAEDEADSKVMEIDLSRDDMMSEEEKQELREKFIKEYLEQN